MEYKTGSLICWKKLIYLENAEKKGCYYLLEKYDTNVTCIDRHFICDKCHSLPANDLIEQTYINSKLEDPIELSLILLKNPKIKLH